jgi:hypothetical protein
MTPMPGREEVPEEAVLAERLRSVADRIAMVPVQIEDANICRRAAAALAAARNQERQRLARQGELPEALASLNDFPTLATMVAAALTVAEEDAAQSERQRIQEALKDHDVQNQIAAAIGRLERDETTADGMAVEIAAALDTLEADPGPETAPGAAVEVRYSDYEKLREVNEALRAYHSAENLDRLRAEAQRDQARQEVLEEVRAGLEQEIDLLDDLCRVHIATKEDGAAEAFAQTSDRLGK